MNDLLPEQAVVWHHVESVLREVGWQYGYQEIRTPMLEKTALFKQSIGDQTDIVEKEMYTFTDSGEDSLSLRPEATASTVRACLEHGIVHNRQQRLWYMGPMFRRERPQKGRYRQFHQFGIEAFGWSGPDIDAEIILVGERIWKLLGLSDVTLEINTLGSDQSRATYREALKEYFSDNQDQLDDDSKRRLERNPLRILDSKNPKMSSLISNAPDILEYLEPEERTHFDGLCQILDESSIGFSINPRLVRGLDYYTSTVFEWSTGRLGAQSAVCAGGRYDSLVENRGGRPTPAIGFAMGMERVIELVTEEFPGDQGSVSQIYMMDVTEQEMSPVIVLAERLRDLGIRVTNHFGGGKLKSQLRRADQSGAPIGIIVGDQEQQSGQVQIKYLRENVPQENVAQSSLEDWARGYFGVTQ